VKRRVKVSQVPSGCADGVLVNFTQIEPPHLCEIVLPGEFVELYDDAGRLWVGRIQVTNYTDKTAWVETRWHEYNWSA
jgi:hypothetical protein